MDQVREVQATIKGDVSGQVAVGNYILQIENVNGGTVNFAPHSDRPAYSLRPSPVQLRPRAFPLLLDREKEFADLKTAAQSSTPVSIYGEEGIGKTSFVRQLAHLQELEDFPDGVVWLDGAGYGLDDLLQALFDIFCERLPDFKPRNAEIFIALQGRKAVILLDSLKLSRDEVISLLGSVPSFTFILSSIERSLWGEGQIIALQGLPEADSLVLFEREVARPLNEEERALAKRICLLLKGHPLRILQATALVHEKSKSISEVLEQLESDVPEKAIVQASLSTLDESQKRSLAILAAAGGFVLPREHLVALAKDPNVRKTLQELIALGLAQAHSPRYSLTGDLASSLANLWNLSPWEDVLLDYYISWLEGQPAQALIEESAEAVIHTVKKAAEKEKWPQVIRLGRALERSLILWKRWQAWFDLLNLILEAARALGDRKVEALALHQLGSRAMCLGQAEQARELLTEALNIRKAIRDRAGQEVTQHNLKVLLRASVPPNGGKSGGRPWYIGGSAILMAFLMSVLAISVVFSQEALYTPILTAIPIQLPVRTIAPPDQIIASPTITPTPTQPSASPTPLTFQVPDTGPSDTPTSNEATTVTDTPTPTETPTATQTSGIPPSRTPTPSNTPTPTQTATQTPTTSTKLGLPDLQVVISGPPSATAGKEVAVIAEVSNLGNTLASGTLNFGTNGYMVDVVISRDAVVPDGWSGFSPNYGEDILLLGGRFSNTPDLMGGQQAAVQDINPSIPADTPTGNYYICARVDPGASVVESNESNNVSCAPIWIDAMLVLVTPTFTSPPPDITAPMIKDIRLSNTEVEYPFICNFSNALTVYAVVEDDLSGVDSVTLWHGYNGDTSFSQKMTPIDSITYQATIDVGPEADQYLRPQEGTLDLMVEAWDLAGNANKADGGRVLVHFCPGLGRRFPKLSGFY